MKKRRVVRRFPDMQWKKDKVENTQEAFCVVAYISGHFEKKKN